MWWWRCIAGWLFGGHLALADVLPDGDPFLLRVVHFLPFPSAYAAGSVILSPRRCAPARFDVSTLRLPLQSHRKDLGLKS